jgi:hypothetical protein
VQNSRIRLFEARYSLRDTGGLSARVSFRGILTNSEELDRSAASSPSRASTR